MAVARRKAEDASERDALQAWLVAALSRSKRLPEARTFTRRRGQRQTLTEQRAALEVMSQQYGIPLRKHGESGPVRRRRSPRG